MDKAQQRRWLVLLSLFGATLTAIFYPVDEVTNEPPPPRKSRAAILDVQPRVAVSESQAGWLAAEENPFAPRGWVAPPPQPVDMRTVAPVIATESTPEPPPPPLPFRFLGQMSDGEDRVIYLALGEQVVPARQGDILDGRFKVAVIGSNYIEFETISSGLRQTLPLPAQDR